ncbi:MAG: glycosyltransferase family 2 protein, partial [Cetobacterium sp.]
ERISKDKREESMEKEMNVSIIIPTYNRGYIIKKSIESVLDQTYQNFELIIVDDCSKDDTENVIESINDSRIKYIKLEKNSGANKARNIGVENSKYNIIAFHDSDDIWHKDKLEKQLKFFLEGKYDVVASAYNQYVNDKYNCVIPLPKKDFNIDICSNLLKGNFISTQTILGKKKCFLDEKFDNELQRFQDWDLAIRLSQKYEIGFINEPTVDVYVQENSISKDDLKKYESLKIILEKYYDEINKNDNLFSEFCRGIYISSIIANKKDKKWINIAYNKEKNLRNIIFKIISILNVEFIYKIYYNKKNIL